MQQLINHEDYDVPVLNEQDVVTLVGDHVNSDSALGRDVYLPKLQQDVLKIYGALLQRDKIIQDLIRIQISLNRVCEHWLRWRGLIEFDPSVNQQCPFCRAVELKIIEMPPWDSLRVDDDYERKRRGHSDCLTD